MGTTGTSKLRWFIRGLAGGVILFAALNALSWFFRSAGWSDLCGATQNDHIEAIGFPFEIWREGVGYKGGWMVGLPSVGINLLVALAFATISGFSAVVLSERIEAMLPAEQLGDERKPGFSWTFSVRSLLLVTSLLAVAIGLTKSLGSSPLLLGTIYCAGPLILILIAMAPSGIPWEQRSIILIATAVLMLVGAVLIGGNLGMEFDRVLLGVFICWVPQSAFAVMLIMGFAFWQSKRMA